MTEKIVDVNSIDYGIYSVLVGLTESGELLIAQPTIEILMGWDEKSYRKKIASKSLKDFAGEGFHSAKIKLSGTFHYNAATNFVYYEEFLTVVKWQTKLGNMQAIDILVAGFADSFSDFAYKSFGKVLTDKERQDTLKARMLGKVKRVTLTDAIKAYVTRHSKSPTYEQWIYPNVTDAVNKGVFNRRASKLREDWDTKNPRDKMTEIELDYVKQVEDLASRLIEQDDIEPVQAIKEALARLIIPTQTR